MADNAEKKEQAQKPICFVIMPFSDPEGYKPGHFKKVYEQIFKPAIEAAGYAPFRMDDSNKSTLIHADMFAHLVNDSMALCDLSAKNPNVLYELGIRHAFDKPVVLVQEKGQERIFDIAGLTTLEYRKDRLYDEVIEDQEVIAEAIRQTAKSTSYSVMSLVNLGSAKVDHGKSLSEKDRTEILLLDISQRLSRLENQTQSNQQDLQLSSVGDAEKRLRVLRSRAMHLMNKADEDLRPSDFYLTRVMRDLEAAIIDCQQTGSQNTALIVGSQRTLVDLAKMLSVKEESMIPVG